MTTLPHHCGELQELAALLVQEIQVISCMRSQGAAPDAEAEALTIATGISQIALMHGPLICEAIRLEQEAAWVA